MRLLTTLVLALAALAPAWAQPINVVTTQPDLWDLATRIGGAEVEVSCLTSAKDNLHLVQVRPSMMNKVRRADLFIEVGLALEHAWAPALLEAARNDRVKPGGEGFVDASVGLRPLEVPPDLSRSEGVDLHASGNPHYNLDPEGGRLMARNIHAALVRKRPAAKETFDRNLAAFEAALDERLAKWRAAMKPLEGAAFMEGHAAWTYFAARFGLRIAGRLEPKPGLAPTAAHLAGLVETAKASGTKLFLATPKYEDVARKLAAEAGGSAVVLDLSSALEGETRGYLEFLDHVVATFTAHLAR